MDKRTLLFIVAVSLSLFFVNLFFQYQGTQKREEWVAQQKQKESIKKQKLEAEIVQKTAPLSALPIVNLYADADGKQLLAAGIAMPNQVLTLSWSQEVPQKVYAQTDKTGRLQAYSLSARQPGLGTVLLYQQKPSSLTTEALSPQGHYDLQLVSLQPQIAGEPISVTFAEYVEGRLQVLEDKITSTKDQNKRYAAIALLKHDQDYVPVGVFNANSKTFIALSEIPELAKSVATPNSQRTSSRPDQKQDEKYFVLENSYQQLVFSNHGAALAEINLPFKTKENNLSAVREIEFDRKMVQDHPYNAVFPAHGYYTASQKEDKAAFEWHEKGKLGGYYPLLRRDLIETGKRQSIVVKPQYYALNIVSEYPELAELVYEVKEFTDRSITFEAAQNYRRITKTYSFGEAGEGGLYCINLEIRVDGDSRGLWITSGVPEVEWISGGAAPTLKFRITRNQKAEVENIDLPKDTLTVSSVYPDWICSSNGFLGSILDPLTEIDPGFRVQYVSGTTVPSRLVEIDQENERFKAANMPGYMTLLPLKSKGGNMSLRLFAGPFDSDVLKQIDAYYSDPATGYNPDYIACQTMHGWFTFISEPFAKFLYVLMQFFHYLTNSWAFSIVLLTICLRLILYPLNNWSTKSMVRMQQIAPEVTAIQEKYKKDPKKSQLEIMNLYREKGINPASGCLPLLIQMPFLVGMFDLLKSSFALRGAPFIPGWIDDLTAPDVLFSWKYPIFFIGNEFHLLPILLGVVMFVQQKFFSTAPKDPQLMSDQQRQQQMMGSMMAVVFTIMFYNFPSGLNIYWLSSMLLGMLQQWYLTKQMQKKHVLMAPTAISSKKIK